MCSCSPPPFVANSVLHCEEMLHRFDSLPLGAAEQPDVAEFAHSVEALKSLCITESRSRRVGERSSRIVDMVVNAERDVAFVVEKLKGLKSMIRVMVTNRTLR